MELNSSAATIYLVDDEFAIRDSLTLFIESTGRQIKSFDSGQAFLDSYDSDQPGCLVLDVKMPLMTGHELQEELAARNINIPIIFISGNADIPDSAKAFRAGAVDFLEKPFDNDLLLIRIDEAIKKDVENRAQLAEKIRILTRFDRLTEREKQVLQLIVNSHSNKEAARILDISHRTIDAHRARVMEKMQAENITKLIAMVMGHDLMESIPLDYNVSDNLSTE